VYYRPRPSLNNSHKRCSCHTSLNQLYDDDDDDDDDDDGDDGGGGGGSGGNDEDDGDGDDDDDDDDDDDMPVSLREISQNSMSRN